MSADFVVNESVKKQTLRSYYALYSCDTSGAFVYLGAIKVNEMAICVSNNL